MSPDSALAAFEALDRSSFQGRLLHILPAVSRNPAAKGEPKALGGVRGDRNEIKKQDASKSLNWGTLYMNVRDRFSARVTQICERGTDLWSFTFF